MSNKDECVRVCVRIRPLSSKEKQDGRSYIVFADPDRGMISVKNPDADDREPPKNFTFDAAFPPETQQIEVYNGAASNIVEAVLDGFNGTIFAYGQTGAGKSHTMEGYNEPPELRGIIPNSFKHIFDKVQVAENKQFLVRASYLEIYNEEIRDLLSKDPKNKLDLKENIDTGVYVKDLTSITVKDVFEMDHVMQAGKKNRSVGSTLMNQTSSRSHSMFTIVVECCGEGLDGNEHICVGKLNLVDLAGSERQSKTGATGDRLKEATKINLSLSALGNVIKALVDGSSKHVPYRDSKLTRLLQDSLGGNAKTVMIANCGPADYNFDETVSTLRYANRAKNIKNKPKINEDPKDAMLREHQEEIQRLRAELEAQAKGLGSVQIVDGKEVPVRAPEKQIVEKVVEKIVVKREGMSEEELQALQEKALREKNELKKKAQAEMKALMEQQAKTHDERKALEQELKRKAEEKESLEKNKESMLSHLRQMEEKLIIGGKIMDKAARQEVELREAQLKLEEQNRQKLLLAREVAERDDANMMLEEKYSSMQEEVDVKTKKLKKLWQKHKSAAAEMNDLTEEFHQERDDMLDTIRELQKQLKLKQLVRANFVPIDDAMTIKKRARWDEDTDEWVLQKLELDPTSFKPRRPVSYDGLRRPETEYARHRKQFDTNDPRFKCDDVIRLELDMPERTTEDYDGDTRPVEIALEKLLQGEPEEIIVNVEADDLPNFSEDPALIDAESKSSRRKARPATASRRRPSRSST